MIEPDSLLLGDCLDVMKDIPDGSVDMILCDLPYGNLKGIMLKGWSEDTTKWDDRLDTSSLFYQYERILRMGGSCLLFSQEPYTSHLRTYNQYNLPFNYPMMWKKQHFANPLACNKAPVSYFEDITVFHKEYDSRFNNPLRDYFKHIKEYLNLSTGEILSKYGRSLDHCLRTDSLQFTLCTAKAYQILVNAYDLEKMEGYKPYSQLQKEYQKSKQTFNLPEGKKFISNVLEFDKNLSNRLHPTQKPVALCEYLIKTYTNEGDTVLDNCMGSGTTCLAALNTNRHYIGIEKDEHYFNIAKERIESAKVVS